MGGGRDESDERVTDPVFQPARRSCENGAWNALGPSCAGYGVRGQVNRVHRVLCVEGHGERSRSQLLLQ